MKYHEERSASTYMRRASDYAVSLIVLQERKKGELGRKNLSLQCSSEKLSD